ncbi:MAG: acyl carrier protein [Caulobacteraceae bacterium]
MQRGELYSIIKEVLALTFKEKDFGFDINTINDNVNLIETLGINSIASIEIIVRLENKLDIEFDDENLSPEIMESVSSLADHIEELQKQQGKAS